jgi:hypothetical protein
VKTFFSFIIALGTCLVFETASLAQAMSEINFKASQERIGAIAKATKVTCAALTGNTRDICIVQTNGRARIDRAELDAIYKPSARTHYLALTTRADADFSLSNTRCNERSADIRETCRKEAMSQKSAARASAKTKFKQINAHAAELDRHNVRFAFAKDMCDRYSDTDKDACMNQAMLQLTEP